MKLTDPATQLGEFAASLFVGFLLGGIFDMITVLGRKGKFLRHFWDLLFSLSVLLGNVYLFLVWGKGVYELYYVIGLALGFILWRKLPGKVFLPIFGKI